jgi:hypothetical protein
LAVPGRFSMLHNPVYNRYHTSQTAATEHCELHNMLWDICIPVPVCQFGRTYISLYLAVTWCTNPACSSDHNYQTTSRQLQATELFKLSRLVVVCLRFLCAGRPSGNCRCTWLCVRLARTLCMWQQPEQLANSCNCSSSCTTRQ